MKLTRAQMIRAAVSAPIGLSLLAEEMSASAQNVSLVKAKQAVAKGLDYLRKTQEADGSWGHYPATTALALSAFLRNGRTELGDPAVARGFQFLTRSAKPNGAIYSDVLGPSLALPNYNTSLAIVALVEAHNAAYRPVIQKAQQYLSKVQFDEEEGINPSNPMYGGIGYGDDPGDETHPDLSNLQHALEALHVSGTPANAPVFKKALIFLQRVQNRRESNDQAWAKTAPNDGGFVYEAQGGSKASEEDPKQGEHTSYGSMTYAGLKSYIYCGVTKSDPRAQAAYDWLRGHYTVTENPGMGTNSLYYYYHTMAKTMDAYGQKIITDKNGKSHDWAQDLSAHLIAEQRPDGSWFNTNARHWENQPGLVTSYTLIALSYCIKK
ncbi:MAG: Squalene cyclase [Chthonomonadaceae bacterium]|nr:Squalene cyclase [Chthonomonadaceae bacterium]